MLDIVRASFRSTLAGARDHSIGVRDCRPVRQAVSDQPFKQLAVSEVSHINRLSSSPSSAGFKTSWKALKNDAIPFAPGANKND